MKAWKVYSVPCVSCGNLTSKKYGRENNGQCKNCATGANLKWVGGERVRASHCEDAPCCGCCRLGDGDYYGTSDDF